MREIIFRGKRVDNGEWIEGYFLPGNERQSLHPCIFVYLPETQSFECFDIDIDTLDEYTGLTDKNGTRVFEGDIIKQVIPHNLVQPFIFTVNWCEECAMFVLPCITNDAFESDFTVMRSDEIEVIGNIHDNPELLKGE